MMTVMDPLFASHLTAPARTIGEHIREWRQRRRLSQLDVALEAEISQKHLSFIESGRASPSRQMVLRLAEHLQVPLRERNAMVLAAGFAPVFAERSLDDPALAPARAAIDLILKGHEPFPALAVDRHWTLVAANAAVHRLLGLVTDPQLLEPPVNVLRLSLSPGGLGPHIVNIGDWSAHVFARLRQQLALTADRRLASLIDELRAMPAGAMSQETAAASPYGGIAMPLMLRTPAGTLSLISTVTIFGTPIDVTVSELALETFYPANAETAALLRAMAGQDPC
jgi:transcriptional regulator with XRE-family HTH domain